ncbi:MAG TPA: carboxypeptidase-like regulatory domain-containing protein, partial [Terracidiphilus sp.]|nr:carboxypeptidase-like regulatory domain-containing protein [Terracidiphilus sp.]
MPQRSPARSFCQARLPLAGLVLALASVAAHAQSTYGAILGTVRDQTGAVVAGASVALLNIGTTAERTAQTDASGNYSFPNIDPGDYKLTLVAPSFQTETVPDVPLTAREVRRVDAVMHVGAATQTVEIIDNEPPVINTEASSLTQTKVGDELTQLPVAVYSRSTGSTSPISTLTTEAGVQTDDSGELAVMGTTAALLSVTIDGISSVGVEYSGPVNEMFPSFNSIEEIQISESNNNAEFSGVADITTVSKAGTIHYHGGLFENNENTVYNAGDPFTLSK